MSRGRAGLRAALPARQTGFEGEITPIEADGAMPPFERPRLSKRDEGSALHKPIVPDEILAAAGLTIVPDLAEIIDRDSKTVILGRVGTSPIVRSCRQPGRGRGS